MRALWQTLTVWLENLPGPLQYLLAVLGVVLLLLLLVAGWSLLVVLRALFIHYRLWWLVMVLALAFLWAVQWLLLRGER